MNLYFRLIWVIFNALRRERIVSTNIQNDIHTRIYPNDLDINLHVNNGRFLTLCDLSRVDMFVRSGLAKTMYRNKWFPVISSVSMTFVKPLHLFDRVRVASHVTHWDEKYFHSTHTLYRGDEVVADGTSRALVVKRAGGRLTPEEVLDAVMQMNGEQNP